MEPDTLIAADDLPTVIGTATTATTRIVQPRRLRTVRLLWVAAVGMALALFVVSIPLQFDVLQNSPLWSAGFQDVLAGVGLSRTFFSAYLITFDTLFIISIAVAAIILFRHRSDDWMALLASLAMVLVAVYTPPQLSALSEPIRGLVGTGAGITVFFVLLSFPDGRFVPRWTRWVYLAQVIWFLLAFISINLFNATGLERLTLILPPLFAIFGLGAQVYRFRRVSSPLQRQQTKLALLGFTGAVMGVLIMPLVPDFFPALSNPAIAGYFTAPVFTRTSLIALFIMVPVFLGAQLLPPVTVALAVMRHRLWDADLTINRSLVYGALIVVLGLIFTVVFIVLQTLLSADQSGLTLIIAAVAAGGLFNPVRQRTQNLIDRRVFRLRFDLNELKAAQKTQEIKHPGYLTGRLIGRYEVLGVLGKGGMGEVYHATADEQAVALKVLPIAAAAEPMLIARFQREAQTLTALDHPHIVRIFDAGEDQGIHYMAMEYIDGQELNRLMRKQRGLTLDVALPIIADIATALDYVHGQGMVHRDLKPSNIMLRDGVSDAVLMDFGIVKPLQGTRYTSTGVAIGTINYMAPEQIGTEHEIDRRTDIYALGVIVYEMLTGALPFEASSAAQMMFAHLQQPAPDPRDRVPDMPGQVAKAILKALAKDPDDRFQSAGAFAQALGG